MLSKELGVRTKTGSLPNRYDILISKLPVRKYPKSKVGAKQTPQIISSETPKYRERIINPKEIVIAPGRTYLTNVSSFEGRNFFYLFEPKVKPFFLSFSAGIPPDGFIRFVIRHHGKDAEVNVNGSRASSVQNLKLGDIVNIDNGFFYRVEKVGPDRIWQLSPLPVDEIERIKSSQLEKVSDTLVRLPDLKKVTKPIIIGRATPHFFDIDVISREHFVLEMFPDYLIVANLKSRNGLQVNGIKLGPTQQTKVYEGDILSLGNVNFRVSVDVDTRWTMRLLSEPSRRVNLDGATYAKTVRKKVDSDQTNRVKQAYAAELPVDQRERTSAISLPYGGRAIVMAGSEIPFSQPAANLISRTILETTGSRDKWNSLDSVVRTYQEIIQLSSVRLQTLLAMCRTKYPHVYLKWMTGRHDIPSAIGASIVFSSFTRDVLGNRFLVYAQIGRARSWLIHENDRSSLALGREISFQPKDSGSLWFLSDLDATIKVVPDVIKVIPLDLGNLEEFSPAGLLIYADTRSPEPLVPKSLEMSEVAAIINRGKAPVTEKFFTHLQTILEAWVNKQGTHPEEAALTFLPIPIKKIERVEKV